MLSIHWLYRRSRNSVVKTFGNDVIPTSYDVNFQYGGRQRIGTCPIKAIRTLKSNAGDQKVCKKKNLSWLFGADKKSVPRDHYLASLGRAS